MTYTCRDGRPDKATAGSGGVGDVSGPASSTDNAIVRWDGTSGDTVQDSDITISDKAAGVMSLYGIAGDFTIEGPNKVHINCDADSDNSGQILFEVDSTIYAGIAVGGGFFVNEAGGTITTPLGSMEIKGNANPKLTLRTNNTTGDGVISWSDTTGDDRGIVGYNHTSEFLTFSSGAVENMRLGNGGFLLIKEANGAGTDYAAFGQLWVKDDAPNILKFTDDAGTDFSVTMNGLLGDGTANRTVRIINLAIEDGTNASTLKCSFSSRFNGDTSGDVDNISKGATTGIFTLSANGSVLTIEAAGLTGNAVGIHTSITRNKSAGDVYARGTIVSNDLVNTCEDQSGTVVDLTTAVDTGAMELMILYITDA